MANRTFPVAEIYGPVIEGEGHYAGQPTTFVRFGGCDSRCVWCDSDHAVRPELVRTLSRLSTIEIVNQIKACPGYHSQITFSGGNPALFDLTDLVMLCRGEDWTVKVETQGTIWNRWLQMVDHLVISPKPPSARDPRWKNGLCPRPSDYANFMHQVYLAFAAFARFTYSIKIVVFDEDDFRFAIDFATEYHLRSFYLSCGTHREDDRDSLGARYRWLSERVTNPDWRENVTQMKMRPVVLPQLHVFAYLHELGV